MLLQSKSCPYGSLTIFHSLITILIFFDGKPNLCSLCLPLRNPYEFLIFHLGARSKLVA
jgi:hypothetical protein